MNRDIRDTKLYKELEEYFSLVYRPGTETIIDAADVTISPDEKLAAFTGTRIEGITGSQITRICLVNIETGQMKQVTQGPNSDRRPLWSPDGKTSVLAMYPEAVHGCRRFPEIIDSATRTIDWFLTYMPQNA